MKIEDIFHNTINEYGMIQSGDGIVVGFSGGPDSTALVHLLYRFKEHYNIRLVCAHLNHKFRPGDAEEDAKYVQAFCRERGIRCIVECEDVPRMAAREGLSPEQAGRRARYDLFNRVMQGEGFNKIAVAHNRDDQVETVLMRLIRGAGVEGLGGIKPVRGNIIRPLLEVPRSMIEDYCKEHWLNPVTDKTNLSPVYFRNRIRLELLPCLRDNYNSNIDRAVLGAARVLRWENDFIAGAARDEFSRLAEEQGTGRLEFSAEKLLELHTAVLWRVLRMAVEHLLGDANNLELVHIEKLYALLEKGETGKRINLPRGIVAGGEYGRFFVARQPHPAGGIEETYRLAVPGSTSIHEADGVIEAKIFSMEDYKRERNTADDRRAFLDLAKTGRNLVVTGRKKGDRFNPLGMAGTKKLKDFFIDQKVPRNKRDLVPIVRSGRDIIWIAGYRIDEKYKVTADTRKVLELEFRQF